MKGKSKNQELQKPKIQHTKDSRIQRVQGAKATPHLKTESMSASLTGKRIT